MALCDRCNQLCENEQCQKRLVHEDCGTGIVGGYCPKCRRFVDTQSMVWVPREAHD